MFLFSPNARPGVGLVAFDDQPVLIGTAVWPYHTALAFVTDRPPINRIIDKTVTRKLMQEVKRRSLSVSLCAGALPNRRLCSPPFPGPDDDCVEQQVPVIARSGHCRNIGYSVCSCSLSPSQNLIVLRGVYRRLRHVQRGDCVTEEDVDALLHSAARLACSAVQATIHVLFRKSLAIFIRSFCCSRLVSRPRADAFCSACSGPTRPMLSSHWSVLIFPALFAAA